MFRESSREPFCTPPPPILNRVESELTDSRPVKTIKKKKYKFHCFIDRSVEVNCIVTVIVLENMFGNIKSAVFTLFKVGTILVLTNKTNQQIKKVGTILVLTNKNQPTN